MPAAARNRNNKQSGSPKSVHATQQRANKPDTNGWKREKCRCYHEIGQPSFCCTGFHSIKQVGTGVRPRPTLPVCNKRLNHASLLGVICLKRSFRPYADEITYGVDEIGTVERVEVEIFNTVFDKIKNLFGSNGGCNKIMCFLVVL